MSQFSQPANYTLIESRLETLGQKHRVQCLFRGIMLWIAVGVVSALGAGLIAHFAGQGTWALVVGALWLAALLGTAGFWILRPMLMSPEPLEVARLIEGRLPHLQNGLTNSVLLARADDLQNNAYVSAIFDEVLIGTRNQPLDQAIHWRDLKPLGIKLGAIIGLGLLLLMILPGPFLHGWRQMFSPSTFVPVTGSMEILDVSPKGATLVAGQSLEISMTARGPGMPEATLFIEESETAPAGMDSATADETKDGGRRKSWQANLPPGAAPGGSGAMLYSYRMERVDRPLKFRLEVGRSQTAWYDVQVVKQVRLTDLALVITAPAYTKIAEKSLAISAGDVEKTPVSAPEGSRVQIAAGVDVPVQGAMLQVGNDAPVPMDAITGGQRFSGSVRVMQDTQVSILLTQGGQIIARLPEKPLAIQCKKDAAPTISMRWPTQDTSLPPGAEIKVASDVRDDYGVQAMRILSAPGTDAPLAVVHEQSFAEAPLERQISFVLPVADELRRHGQSLRVQVEVIDNRDLVTDRAASTGSASVSSGGQTTRSPVYEIKFSDPETIAKDTKEQADKLRQRLMEMLQMQQKLLTQTVVYKGGDVNVIRPVQVGQTELQTLMLQTAQTFKFDEKTKIIQKTLLVLAYNPAKDAVALADAILEESVEKEQRKLGRDLQGRQRRIISALEQLLANLNNSKEPATQPTTKPGADMPNRAEALTKLNEQLKDYMKQQQRILDQSAGLAKKPVDDWSDADKKLLDALAQSQDKMDAFMKPIVSDFSKLTQQDMANASLLSQVYELYSEVTMAKDALKAKNVEMATALEDNAVGIAQEMSMNIEKWLMNAPDRQEWKMEDPVAKTDLPMPELPKELEDMVGELMEQQEDLMEEMEDANANYAQSEGSGWDAADGPIESMSAQGVTGNALPNNNDLGGRSGEGRSGRSQGEMVEENASGKGGRNTPTRLDPTPFQTGEVKDTSKDPVGGATGGGKISGQGASGLEGPVPAKLQAEMARLADKQAQLRNSAERLDLQYGLGRYDNFKMLESVALMRRVESDMRANRYQNALRRKDVLVDSMETSHLLLSGQIHVQDDSSPSVGGKLDDEIGDAMKGNLPAAWSDALKEYYRKLGTE